jgi:hydroxylamine reductase (hybrid-cluster protein)
MHITAIRPDQHRNEQEKNMNEVIQNEACCGTAPWKLCIENGDVFFKSLGFGRIRGIAALPTGVAPSTELIPLAQELIKRDILVVLSDSAAADVEKAEQNDPALFEQVDSGLLDLCEFIGINPVLYMNLEIDGPAMRDFYAQQVDLIGGGIDTLPLTEMVWQAGPAQEPVYGTVISMGSDPMENADRLEDCIHEKRLALNWCDRFYCDEVAYS